MTCIWRLYCDHEAGSDISQPLKYMWHMWAVRGPQCEAPSLISVRRWHSINILHTLTIHTPIHPSLGIMHYLHLQNSLSKSLKQCTKSIPSPLKRGIKSAQPKTYWSRGWQLFSITIIHKYWTHTFPHIPPYSTFSTMFLFINNGLSLIPC